MHKVFKMVLGIRSEFSNLSLFYGGDEIGDYHFFYAQFYSFFASNHITQNYISSMDTMLNFRDLK